MILAFSVKLLVGRSLVAAALILPVSVDRSAPWPPPERGTTMPFAQKDAAVRPLVSSATECIARTVAADPRFAELPGAAEFNDLIVESVSSCTDNLRAMIDAYDRVFGEGAGETFFSGPYLDGLSAAVTTRIKGER